MAAAVLLLVCAAACSGGRRPAPPGGPPPAPAPPPVTARLDQPFGLAWDGYATAARYAPAIAGYRGGGTFHDITWCAVEPAPGEPRWTAEDKVVDAALRYGYEVLVRIHIGSCWASGRPPSSRPRIAPSYPPVDLNAYRSFVRTLVGHYSAKGVHLYAIENEIDAENYWGGDPSAYPPVARAGAAAVRAADPRARLVDPGLSSSSYGLAVAKALDDAGRANDAVAFYQRFYARRGWSRLPRADDEAGLRRAYGTAAGRRILAAHAAVGDVDRARVFDVYQLHYYDPWEEAAGVIDYIRRHIPAGMPIEAWELGSFWPGPTYDPARHAAETAKLVTTLLSAGVRRAVYLPLVHSPGVIAPEERWRGLYDEDGRARPVSGVLDRLRDDTRAGIWRPLDQGGLRGALVERADGVVLILWSADGRTRSLHAPPAPASVPATVTPLPRNVPRTWPAGALELSGDPVIVATRASRASVMRWLATA